MGATVFLLLLSVHSGLCVKVHTKVGTIEGFTEEYGGKRLDRFLGIPFAEAPVGSLRFAAPQPKKKFNKIFIAKQYGNVCTQDLHVLSIRKFTSEKLDFRSSEDCLNLNVFVPDGVEAAKDKAVMVWVFGGGFGKGAPQIYDLRPIAAIGDVITVSLNHRLGIFGFFTTGDSVAAGNYGLLDQTLALKWVKENIRAFGGDSDSITFFGQSAGAASVTSHALSPLSQGLFRRVIAQSGVVLNPWAGSNNYSLEMSKQYAVKAGCGYLQSEQTIECLRRIPAKTLFRSNLAWPNSEIIVPMGPIADGHFFPKSPWELGAGHDKNIYASFKNIDILVGVTSNEASPIWSYGMRKYAGDNNFVLEDGLSQTHFRELLRRLAEYDNDLIGNTTWRMYAKSKHTITIKEIEDLVGDGYFLSQIVAFARYHASPYDRKTGRTYFYQFRHLPNKAVFGKDIRLYESRDPWLKVAGHSDEIPYLFMIPVFPPADIPLEEVHLSRALITYWTNFAKTGDPNKPNQVYKHWPEFNAHSEEYLIFDIKEKSLHFTVEQKMRHEHVAFWTDVIWKILEDQRMLRAKQGQKKSRGRDEL